MHALTFSSRHFKCDWVSAVGRVPRSQQYLLVVLRSPGSDPALTDEFTDRLALPGLNFLLLDVPRKRGLRSRLTGLLEELEGRGWESRRIFLFGIGENGHAAFDLALNYTKAFAGAILSGGVRELPESWRSTLPAAAFHTAWLVIHGLFDRVFDIQRARQVVKQLEEVGLPVFFKELNKDDAFDWDVEFPLLLHWLKLRLPRGRSLTSPLGRYSIPGNLSAEPLTVPPAQTRTT